MKDKLLISVVGNQNAGKSETWKKLFDKTDLRTTKNGNSRRLEFPDKHEFVEVFLINGSPEERGLEVEDIIKGNPCSIVLCSIQYTEHAFITLEHFINNGFFIYTHWLNPGFNDLYEVQVFDSLGLTNRLLSTDSLVGIRNAKDNLDERVEEIRNFIYQWASENDLIIKKN